MDLKRKTEITYVKGVGPVRAGALNGAGIFNVDDLIQYFPRRYLDRSNISRIADIKIGEEYTIIGRVVTRNMISARRRRYYQVTISDGSGLLNLKWFNGLEYIKKLFQKDTLVAVSGRVEFYQGLQIIHPEYELLDETESKNIHTGRIIPLYPSSSALRKVGLESRGFRRLIFPLLEQIPRLYQDYFPEHFRRRYQLCSLVTALRNIHFPETVETLSAARYRLKFDELFFLQLMLLLRHRNLKQTKKPFSYPSAGPLLRKIYETLPFELTAAQKRVIKEIWADMKSPHYMNRLLQGDVGSGKTIVALMVASIAMANGYQVALMAPTEILAEQHYFTIQRFCQDVEIKHALLIGSTSAKERAKILPRLQNGEIQLLVGTHTLFQEGVNFKNLSLVIIDEQHRFGVMQRAQLIEKGITPDVLVMTATPIPRSLSMTIYGDMDISLMDELPARKASIHTRVIDGNSVQQAYRFIREEVEKGYKAYIIYPLIEESEKMELGAAVKEFERLQNEVFPELRLSLLHGRLSAEEKQKVMEDFVGGETQILVSTTVIEVGIDNPLATVMIIENAERFGLTQLHQLRGRIGRGERDGYCFLVRRKRSRIADKRLEIIASTVNGFEISEEDLKLRGPGEFFGTRQSGWLRFKIADILTDGRILREARKAVKEILKEDPKLESPQLQSLKNHFLTHYKEYSNLSTIL